jgi:hypothetical protein
MQCFTCGLKCAILWSNSKLQYKNILFCGLIELWSVKLSWITCYIRARCWWRSWLRHCATSRKVAGSIPNVVIGIFHWHNPSGRTMGLGSTPPLTQMITGHISPGGGGGGERGPGPRAETRTPFFFLLFLNLGASTSWNTQGLPRSVIGLIYL